MYPLAGYDPGLTNEATGAPCSKIALACVHCARIFSPQQIYTERQFHHFTKADFSCPQMASITPIR